MQTAPGLIEHESLCTQDGKLSADVRLLPDGRRVARVHGVIDDGSRGALAAFLERHLVPPVPRMDLDLGDITCLSLTGRAVLIGATHRARQRGIELRVVNPSSAVTSVLGSVGGDPAAVRA